MVTAKAIFSAAVKLIDRFNVMRSMAIRTNHTQDVVIDHFRMNFFKFGMTTVTDFCRNDGVAPLAPVTSFRMIFPGTAIMAV